MSVGASIARGLESGIGLGMRMRDQELQGEEFERRRRLQDEEITQRREDRTRRIQAEDEQAALSAIEAQLAALKNEGAALAQQYGGNVPPEVGADFARRQRDLSGTREGILRKRYEPIVQARKQKLADLNSRLQAGQVDIKDVDDVELYDALTTATRRDPADLLSVNGQPSKVSAAVTDIVTGRETQNEGMMLRGVNVLLQPELKMGVGRESPHGGKIVGKEVVAIVPHPQAPGQVLPVVRVYVQKEGAQASPDAPFGATGYYDAPVTENRSSDPNDPIKSIDLNKAFDYAFQMQTLSSMLDDPDVRKKFEAGRAKRQQEPDNFLEAFYALGGSMPKREIERVSVPQGGRVVGFDKRTGEKVFEERGDPKPATGLQAQIDAVQAYAEENGISEAEAATRLQRQGLLKAPKGGAGGGGGGGGGDKPGKGGVSPNEGVKLGLTGEAFLATLGAEDRVTVKSLADGDILPKDLSVKGNRREQLLAWAKQYKPDAKFTGEKLKDLPSAIQTSLRENLDSYRRAARALAEMQLNPDATGLKGFLPDQVLQRVDPDGVDARAEIADLGSLVIHQRSGAAVTAAEFPRLAPFIPTPKDDPATTKKKLERFMTIYREETEALLEAYGEDKGFKPPAIKMPEPKALIESLKRERQERRGQAASGTATPAPAPAAQQPVAVQTPADAMKLPPGTRFRTPDGREFIR